MKPSIRVQLFASPIVNLLRLFKIFVSLKSKVDCTSYKLNKKGNVSFRDGKKCIHTYMLYCNSLKRVFQLQDFDDRF